MTFTHKDELLHMIAVKAVGNRVPMRRWRNLGGFLSDDCERWFGDGDVLKNLIKDEDPGLANE